ncbi:hypothetical protein IG631_20495 [Alternaria alternata]|nr:hypothetical protein IG631_20495 [Alternaria alternata]
MSNTARKRKQAEVFACTWGWRLMWSGSGWASVRCGWRDICRVPPTRSRKWFLARNALSTYPRGRLGCALQVMQGTTSSCATAGANRRKFGDEAAPLTRDVCVVVA